MRWQRRSGGGVVVGRQRWSGGDVLLRPPPRAGCGLSLAASAAAGPSWGAGALPPLGVGGGVVGRLRRRGGVVLCPPPRVFYGQKLESWCREVGREDLLEEWDDPHRGPGEVTRGSPSVMVRWKCRECGHGWPATPNTRTNSNHPRGCPACAGRVATATNNLKVWCETNWREDLLREWAHPNKAPEGFTPGSKEEVQWKCGECGWGWKARIGNRTSSKPSGCPGCAGKVVTATNNLAVWCGTNGREYLLGEWAHPDKGPEDFTPHSAAKVPWGCGECRRGWEAAIYSRTRSKPNGCPGCAGSTRGGWDGVDHRRGSSPRIIAADHRRR